MDYQLWQGDCLEEMDRIEDGSIDAIICDLPYGTTACKWDTVIPFEPLWKQYKRVIKKNGAIVLFGSEPFSSLLRLSNLDWYKYDWVWDKVATTNHLNCTKQPLRSVEDLLVFYKFQSTYNPILREKPKSHIRANNIVIKKAHQTYGKIKPIQKRNEFRKIPVELGYPKDLIQFRQPVGSYEKARTIHPTQKPVALLEYLIKTYTNEGEIVLDNTFGSCSTGEACLRTNRRFIGIEKDANYFEIGKARLERVAADLRGELNHLPMFQEIAA